MAKDDPNVTVRTEVEQAFQRAIDRMTSVDLLLNRAADWLLARGWKPVPEGKEILVVHDSSPGVGIPFSKALAFEVDLWFRKTVVEAVVSTKEQPR